MRTVALDVLFPRIRQKLLGAFLLSPDKQWYLRGLARHIGVTPSSLQREIESLLSSGLILRSVDGNRFLLQANSDHPLFPELQGIMRKSIGAPDVLVDALAPFVSHILAAAIFGSFATGEGLKSTSDVDLMIIGAVDHLRLSTALRQAERALGRAVNPVVYSQSEFAAKVISKNHFLSAVLAAKKLDIIGDINELERAALLEPRSTASDKQAGA